MPRPLATPVRQAIAWRWRQGQDARTIADDLGLVARTVRRFLRRLRRDESDDLRPAYARADPDTADDPVYQAAVALRQAHPAGGGPGRSGSITAARGLPRGTCRPTWPCGCWGWTCRCTATRRDGRRATGWWNGCRPWRRRGANRTPATAPRSCTKGCSGWTTS